MMRLADQPPLTLAFAGLATLGGLVLATAMMPAILFAPSVPRPSAPALPELDGTAMGGAPLSAYDGIFERPLFNPGRARDPEVAPAQANALPALADYRLVGIVISKTSRLALVEDRSAKRVIVLHPGDSFAGRRVSDVLAAGVALSGPSGVERLAIPKAGGLAAHP